MACCPEDKLYHTYCQMGFLCEAKGEYDEAYAWHEKGAKLAPEDGEFYLYMGEIVGREKGAADAEHYYRRAIECSDVCMGEAYWWLGCALRAQERYWEAVECFEIALRERLGWEEAKSGLKDVRAVMDYQRK